jgi:hypothetical protein
MFKKILTLTLALVMAVGVAFTMASCGDAEADMTDAPLAAVELKKDFDIPSAPPISDATEFKRSLDMYAPTTGKTPSRRQKSAIRTRSQGELSKTKEII